jgi:hypothetical protein
LDGAKKPSNRALRGIGLLRRVKEGNKVNGAPSAVDLRGGREREKVKDLTTTKGKGLAV